jgi:hypothetical protein
LFAAVQGGDFGSNGIGTVTVKSAACCGAVHASQTVPAFPAEAHASAVTSWTPGPALAGTLNAPCALHNSGSRAAVHDCGTPSQEKIADEYGHPSESGGGVSV